MCTGKWQTEFYYKTKNKKICPQMVKLQVPVLLLYADKGNIVNENKCEELRYEKERERERA